MHVGWNSPRLNTSKVKPSKTTDMEEKTADEVIQMIAEVLAEADGKFIEGIANRVLVKNVKYVGDSMFMVEE